MDISTALARTLLLMRDEFRADVSDAELTGALTGTTVAIVADAETLAARSAQTTFVTIAMLCARSGHLVHLSAPDAPLNGIQAPLIGNRLISALMEVDGRIVPARRFRSDPPSVVDLEIRLGSTSSACQSELSYALVPDRWHAFLSRGEGAEWRDNDAACFGGMAGAAIIAGEVFKCAMRKLRPMARVAADFDEFMQPIEDIVFKLAPLAMSIPSDLGIFDIISGGAITNALLYAMCRIQNVRGRLRLFEPDIADWTNLNRYMLLLSDYVSIAKSRHLGEINLGGLQVQPIHQRYENQAVSGLLANRVLVGADDIPTRWNVQRSGPAWLGVGATTHWSAMASFHETGRPCAGCLHPRDDAAGGFIPTAAFVSFLAGLMQAVYFLDSLDSHMLNDQQAYVTLLRPENPWKAGLSWHPKCPVGHAA